jgi:integrase
MQINSTPQNQPGKPAKPTSGVGRVSKAKKPHKDFPLFTHRNGQWAKKVRGKIVYFGKIVANDAGASAQAALEKWLNEKDDLLAGRIPRDRRAAADAIELQEVIGRFLDAKKVRVDAGEMSPRTWDAYYTICAELVKAFGKTRLITDILPEDFQQLYLAWSKRWGPVRLKAEMCRARTVFIFAYKRKLVKAPVDFGDGFNPPSKKTMRLNRAARGPKMFEADELRCMIDAAGQPLSTMLLLAINAGLGNNDIAQLPLTALDLESGWMTYPRPKTGIMRRCPLWPETVTAIRDWIQQRPMPKTEAAVPLVFLTVRGDGWGTNIKDRPITHQTRKVLDKLGIAGNRNFYGIRHSFETIAGDSRDQVAVDAIMGHDDGSMANAYRERIADERLRAVADHVRAWLFAEAHPKLKIAATA